MNTLFYGDNLEILRNHVPNETADLVYLDPPFNSARNYNLLFKQRKGDDSPAQIMAFEDTWQYSLPMHEDFRQDRRNARLFDLMESLYGILGQSEMMAYVLMMAPRLLELHRVLRPTGSLYLHCDPVASHYLKIIMDVIYGPDKFRNEITWKRTSSHNDAKRKFGDVSDTILFYSKSSDYHFQAQYTPHDEEYLRKFYRFVDEDGRRYRIDNLSSPNPRPNLTYDYKGYKPPAYGWRVSRERMAQMEVEGRLYFPKSPDGRIQQKRYLDEMPGTPVSNVWSDIQPVQSQSGERRGYPTQKPLALLERIIAASTKPGDVVLDPFCGCGTAVIQAERMGRRWMGIDVTYLAVAEIIYRLGSETDAVRDETYSVQGEPKDETAAREFFRSTEPQNHKPFEMWAVSLVEGEPQEKKGGDKGIDGRLALYDLQNKLRWATIQVKGGHLTPSLVRDFARVIERENAPFGIFISLDHPTKQMLQEAENLGFAEDYGSRRIPRMQWLTIKDLLEGHRKPEIPMGYMVPRHGGVGKVAPKQEKLEM